MIVGGHGKRLAGEAICLTIPGLGNSTEGHWQTTWEEERADCRRVELGHWFAPVRDVWVGRIDAAVSFAGAPVVFATHSLGGIAIALWAGEASRPNLEKVKGAMIVAPPDLERAGVPAEVSGFRPTPRARLPFASVVVASSDDPYATIPAARAMANDWGAEFVDIGPHGHMNAASAMGSWAEGQAILDRLLQAERLPQGAARG